MIEITGKHNTAKVFTDNFDASTYSQILSLCNSKAFDDATIRIMPDCHAGVGCVVGTTMKITDKVTPNLVGIDIGCGMLAVKLKEKRIDLPAFDSVIKTYIGAGRDKAKIRSKYENPELEELFCGKVKKNKPIRLQMAHDSIGTLGGGNHFIELDRDSSGAIWLIIHTGSRHLGIEVCNWYQNQAYTDLKNLVNDGGLTVQLEKLISKLKSEGKARLIEQEIVKYKKQYAKTEKKPDIPFEFAYCTGQLFKDYIHDMHITQRHAVLNRAKIAEIILKYSKLHEVDRIETIHNYIDTDNLILRKGAVSAQYNELLVIPINMRDGTLLCKGKGNPDWNYSAPHGAGRLYSRSDAKQTFSLSEYKKTMQEHKIYSSSISSATLDECPMAYKPMKDIVDNISDTVNIIDILKPIYNFKAGNLED